jgi:hypothetical protein
MNEQIEEFLKNNPPKYKLRKYSDEILYLIHEGCTQAKVLQYLKETYELDVTRQTLSSHISYLKKTSRDVPKSKSENSSKPKKSENSSCEKMSEEEFMRRIKGNR